MKIILYLCFCIMPWAFADPSETLDFSECAKLAGKTLYQGIDGWLFFPGDLVQKIEVNNKAPLYLKRLQQALAYRNITVLIANLPARGMLHENKFDLTQKVFLEYDEKTTTESYTEVNELLRGIGFIVPNLLEAVESSNYAQDYGFTIDTHWTPIGARVVAQAVANIAEDLPVYKHLQRTTFEIRERKLSNIGGDLASWAKAGCPHINISKQPKQLYRATHQEKSTNLFGEENQPEVILWGSSNTTGNHAFAPFLKSFLNVDILNQSIGSGGVWSSVLEHFIHHEGNNYPKLAIWAFPYRSVGQLNLINNYRQVIPAIYGVCETNNSRQVVNLGQYNDLNVERLILFVEDHYEISGSGYYLYFNFSDLSIVNFGVFIQYKDTTLDKLRIKRSTVVKNNGKFFLEFSQNIGSSVKSVSLNLPKRAQGTLEAYICKIPN